MATADQDKTKALTRTYAASAVKCFEEALLSESWPNFDDYDDFNEAFNYMYDVFLYHFNTYFPERRVSLRNSKSNNKEWISEEVRNSSNNLRDLYYLKLQHPILKEYYTEAKRNHSSLVTQTKQLYYGNKILNSENKLRTAWSVINNFRNQAKSHSDISLEVDGIKTQHPSVVADIFNNFFISEPHRITSHLTCFSRSAFSIQNNSMSGSMCAFPYSESEMLTWCDHKLIGRNEGCNNILYSNNNLLWIFTSTIRRFY
ncbi:hypothetical protein QE152_g33769 [Popillia japonica]|uniref:Uncharacterized protein n=1 Tax=Popillia japonica TaxID=7064 RepID=A0AAW1IW95_POPJA